MNASDCGVTSPHPAPIARGAELLKTPGSPVRLGEIVQLHAHGEHFVHELVASLEASRALISQRLRAASEHDGRTDYFHDGHVHPQHDGHRNEH